MELMIGTVLVNLDQLLRLVFCLTFPFICNSLALSSSVQCRDESNKDLFKQIRSCQRPLTK